MQLGVRASRRQTKTARRQGVKASDEGGKGRGGEWREGGRGQGRAGRGWRGDGEVGEGGRERRGGELVQ